MDKCPGKLSSKHVVAPGRKKCESCLPKGRAGVQEFSSPELALPALKMLSGAKTFEVSVHHNRQSCTKSLALFHAERESHVNILTAKIIGYKFESVHNKK